jgi:hypothetical protein
MRVSFRFFSFRSGVFMARSFSFFVGLEEGGCAYTPRVCSFFAGMKGNPFGGVLFSHVPFFEGEMSLAEIGTNRN